LRNVKDNDLADRRTAAADAKAALLRGYRATKDAAEPTRLARQAERLAVATARDKRREERDRLKLEELRGSRSRSASMLRLSNIRQQPMLQPEPKPKRGRRLIT
jgi:hypothetical protein